MCADVMEPSHLGSYRLDSLLGRGGMGEVFLAWDERLERHVALKRILPDPTPDERARERFRREARAIARLSHPAIVQVFDLIEAEDGETLVMEYVEGKGLPEVIARGPMELDLVLRLAFEIADGLAEAHGKGLIHRDLKPENVRVTPSGRAKILDFGLARLLWDDGQQGDVRGSLTQSGALVGTVHAMSPEQASGRPVDHRSDLFALGGLIYEMLSGRAPFRGLNVLDTLRRVTSEEPEPLAELRPGLAAELIQLVTGLMEKEPARRPQNARLVADVLEGLRRSSVDGSAVEVPVAPAPTAAGTEPTAEFDPQVATTGVDGEDLPTGEWPDTLLQAAESQADETSEPAVETVVRTLLLTDLVDSTRMVESLGDARASEVWARHDRVARDLLAAHEGLEIDKSDGFLALFERPFDAVAFALAYHRRLAELSVELEVELSARAGVHLGEVRLRHNSPEDVSRGAKALEVEGLAKPMAARLMGLAGARQTLLNHGAFDLARRSAVDDDRWDEDLQWLAHGGYLLQGVEDPVEVYEVGVMDFAPLAAPPDSEKARRTVSFSEELVLGWRPAAGQPVPRRPRWVLERRLGEGGFGEVWLTRHESGEARVFKFCFEASRLRALKREVTLFRLLKEALGHRDDIARVLDWNFETAPYFIEVEHTEGGDLTVWAEQQGGLAAVPIETRVELVAQVADALAAAHSVGVLHKDVKPGNVLMTSGASGQPRVRLTDFGVGGLIDRSVLESQGMPALGFTQTLEDDASTVGSRRYMAPELLEGKPASVPADLYSLGVLLYQMVVGDFSRALAPGWRREVDDELLVEDIALLVDGSAGRRPAGAGPVAERLRALKARRAERQAAHRTDRQRRRLRWAAVVGGVLLVVASALLVQAYLARQQAERLQARAEQAREQAEDLIGFMLGDLQRQLQAIGRVDALEGAGEQALTYFEGLDGEDVGTRTLARHATALNQMGDVRMAQGDLDAAQALFEQSLARSQQLYDQDPTDDALFELGQSHFWAANVHWRRGEYAAAMPDTEAYLRRSQELSDRDPTNADWLLEVSFGHNNVADLLLARHNPPLALEHFRESLAVVERLVALDPTRADWRRRQATAHLKIAEVAYEQGDLGSAVDAADQAIELLEALVAGDPEDSRWRRRLALAHDWAAGYRLDRGELELADRHSLRSLELTDALHHSDPNHVEWRALLASSRTLRGTILGHLDRPAEAEAALLAALDVIGPTAMDDDFSCQMRARAHTALAGRRLAAGRIGEARREARRAVTLLEGRFEPTDLRSIRFFAHAFLAEGEALAAAGRPAEAEVAWRKALELLAERLTDVEGATTPPDLLFLARVHSLLGQRQEAEAPIYTLLGMGTRHPLLLACCSDYFAPGGREPISNPGGAS